LTTDNDFCNQHELYILAHGDVSIKYGLW